MRTFHNRLLFLLTVLLGLSPFSHAQIRESGNGAPGPVKAPHLIAELISDSGTISQGGRSRVALALTLDPGWHVYWVYAGVSGEPPSVKWSVPTGFSVGPMQYPTPSRLPLGPLMDYGYERTAVFPFDLSNSPKTPFGKAGLQSARAMACVPRGMRSGKAYLGLDLKVAPKASEQTNSLIEAAVNAEPVKTPSSVKITASATRRMLTLNVATGKRETAAEYYPLDDDSIRNAADQNIEPTANGVKLTTEKSWTSPIFSPRNSRAS